MDTKTLCGCRGPSDYVSFNRAVKRQRLHTLKHKIHSQEQHYNIFLQMLYTLELDFSPFPTDVTHLLPNVSLRKGFFLNDALSLLYDMIKNHIGSKMEVKPGMISKI